MRKRTMGLRRKLLRALRCCALVLVVEMLFVSLPIPVKTEAVYQGDSAIVPVELSESQNTTPDGDTERPVPLVHNITFLPDPQSDAEMPTVAETIPEETEPYYEPLYTDADAIALAKMGWGEALVTQSDTEIAATMWCAANRFDSGDPYYRNCKTIKSIVEQSGAFDGYSPDNPVDEHLLWLAYDVLDRWNAEQYGETDVGRVLPPEYLFFHGDGRHNYFRVGFEHTGQYYDWSLESPYES